MSDNLQSGDMKKQLSTILDEPRNWKHIADEMPEENQIVIIRMVRDNIIEETDNTIRYYEDSMVAKFSEGHWRIEGPFHKYDWNPFTQNENIKEGTVITNWAIPEDNEVEGWYHRLDFFNEYNELQVIVDPDKEEDVYRAIIWAAAFMENAFNGTNDPKMEEDLRKYYMTLKDLQYAIDHSRSVDDGKNTCKGE